MRWRKYGESLLLILIMLLVGSGIYILQLQGVLPNENFTGSTAFAQDPLNTTTTQLEQIARITHDYLNGYLSGPQWGTALPEENMKEEMEQLQMRYQLLQSSLDFLYPQGGDLSQLLDQFNEGFQLAKNGLDSNDRELLSQSHLVFHMIDYQVFEHTSTDEIYVRD